MQLLDVFEMAKDRKKGQRRMDLFRRENLDTWILCFPPGDVQRMHNHPSDRTYYVLTGRGIMKGLNETHELSPGKIISIPAHEYYEGSNPYDEPMILLGTSHKPTQEGAGRPPPGLWRESARKIRRRETPVPSRPKGVCNPEILSAPVPAPSFESTCGFG